MSYSSTSSFEFGVFEIEIYFCWLFLSRNSQYLAFWCFECYLLPVSPDRHVLRVSIEACTTSASPAEPVINQHKIIYLEINFLVFFTCFCFLLADISPWACGWLWPFTRERDTNVRTNCCCVCASCDRACCYVLLHGTSHYQKTIVRNVQFSFYFSIL